MAKINDTNTFPITTPASDDMLFGTDVSNTSNDANGETVNFTVASLSGFFGIQSVQTFTSSGTWTKPTGINKVLIFLTGGGAYADPQDTGGSGGTAIKLLDVSSVTSATITVGAGGSAFAKNGQNSVWSDGANTVTASGGNNNGSGGGGSGADIVANGGRDAGATFWGGRPAYGVGGFSNNEFGNNGEDGVVFILEFA